MHDETLHYLQSSSSIIRMTEAVMMGWEGNLSRFVGRNIPMWVFGGGNLKEKFACNILANNKG
jgi:hypothetical protein